MHHDRGLGDAEARSAQFDRHGDSQPAGIGHGLVEFVRESGSLIAFGPVIITERGRDPADIFVDGAVVGGECDVHKVILSVERSGGNKPIDKCNQ